MNGFMTLKVLKCLEEGLFVFTLSSVIEGYLFYYLKNMVKHFQISHNY